MRNKAFTLIELLLVVAIIGILATIVISSLNTARNRAKDAKIKTLMSQLRTQAELFALEHGSYLGVGTPWGNDDISECRSSGVGGDGTLLDPEMSDNITKEMYEVWLISKDTGYTRIFCGVGGGGGDSWAFAAPLFNPIPGTTGWCVDSSGNSQEVSFDFNIAGLQLGGNASRASKCP